MSQRAKKSRDFLRVPSCPSWLKVLENARSAHSPSNAHRNQSVTPVAPFQFTNYGRGKLGTGAAQWMSQSNGATAGGYAFRIESSLSSHRPRLRGKGLVQLDHVDVGKFQPRNLQRLRNGKYRPESHFFRL